MLKNGDDEEEVSLLVNNIEAGGDWEVSYLDGKTDGPDFPDARHGRQLRAHDALARISRRSDFDPRLGRRRENRSRVGRSSRRRLRPAGCAVQVEQALAGDPRVSRA